MSRGKRVAEARAITRAPVIQRHDDILEPVYESDPDGRPVVHHRVVDTLGRMMRNGSITREMCNAARDFEATFTIARFDPVVCMSLDRLPGSSNPADLTDAQVDARRRIGEAIDALGGLGSPGGGCVWHVVGMQRSIREWSMRSRLGRQADRREAGARHPGCGAGGAGASLRLWRKETRRLTIRNAVT